MLINVRNPDAVGRLLEFLELTDFDVRRCGEREIEVLPPPAMPSARPELELELYLKVWRATHADEAWIADDGNGETQPERRVESEQR